MALPQVGLEAVIEGMAGFEKAAGIITKSFDTINAGAGSVGKGFLSLGGSVNNFIGTASKVALAGVGIIGAGLIGLGASAISAGSDVSEMQAKFNTVFKSVGGDVANQINEFSDAVGRNKYELQGMTAELGDMFKPMGFAEAAAGDMSVSVTKLAVDLSSFNNMRPEEAFERLRGTLIGNHENALAFGVIINENTLKTELAAMGADKLTGAELEQAKVQARLNLLMKGTTDAQGDAARTASGWANQMRALQSKLEETRQEIGLALLPVVEPLLRSFVEMAKSALPAFVDIVKGSVIPVIQKITEGAGKFATLFVEGWSDAIDEGTTIIDSFVGGLQSALTNVFGIDIKSPIFKFIFALGDLGNKVFGEFGASGIDLGKTLKDAFGGAVEFLTTTILPALTTAIQFVNDNWEAFKGAILGIGAALAGASIASAIAGIVAALGAILSPIGLIIIASAAIGAAWNTNFLGMRDTLTAFWENTAKPALQDLWQWLQVNIPKAIQTASEFWDSTLLPAIKTTWKFINDDLIPTIQAIAAWLKKNVPAAINATRAALKPVVDKILPELVDIFNIIYKWVIKNFPLMQKTITTVINFITDLFKRFNKDTGKFWGEWGDEIKTAVELTFKIVKTNLQNMLDVVTLIMQIITGDWEGAWETIKGITARTVGLIVDLVKASFNNMLKLVGEIMNSIKNKIGDIWSSIVSTVKSKAQDVYDAIKDKFNAIPGLISGYASKLVQAAKDMMQGVINGVTSKATEIYNSINTTLTNAINSVRNSITGGALASILSSAGQAIINKIKDGIAVITDLASRLISTIQSAINQLSSSISSGTLYNILVNVGRNIINYIVNGVKAVTSLASELIAKVQAAINSLSGSSVFSTLYNIGRNIVQGLINGIKAMGSNLYGALRDIVDAAIDKIKDQLGIGSPSKVFYAVGLDMMRGLQAGIARMAPTINTQLQAAVAGPAVNAPALGATGSTSIYNTFQLGGNNIYSQMDAAQFEARVLRVIRRNL